MAVAFMAVVSNNRKLITKTVLPTFVRETVTFVATMRLERHTRREGWSAKGTPWVRTLCSAWASDINVASQKNPDRIFGDNYVLDPFPIVSVVTVRCLSIKTRFIKCQNS